ncbi:hypothetical protein DH2020_033520 [Rehmannia glutinosa]|uniref:COP1-interacting protein 7 n=1 Tax=Rehmannia glutinosa TaxID=99300 RepID=A0ABR0VFX5_REHGL
MDSRTLLDYALFQLTPTRTRCDLVIFAGKKSEKIASGLLEPFVSHLKSAKDQISKGGYSINLQPISSDDCSWFTKATLERFVRFVSTPEVLERFVTIEKEINQIDSSIDESNEQINGTVEVQGTASATDGDPKIRLFRLRIRLQRVLESRKAVLKKEQAMAYARALVAGFEMDYIYDLVSFSDAFGAQRLREACINFMELCNKKNDDKIWMDEVAAMQASYLGASGIILAGENYGLSQTGLPKSSTSDSITRHGSMDTSEGTDNFLPMESNLQQTEGAAQLPTWPNHLPQYMQNGQAPIFQPYPGYIFPGMQVAPWPANFQDFGMSLDRDIKNSQRHKSYKKKEKHANTKNSESNETDHSSSRSNSSDEQDERINNKKKNKGSSRKVVIRNINYIASDRNEDNNGSNSYSSDENEYVNAGSLKHHKSTSQKNKVRDGSKKASNKSQNGIDAENAPNSEEETKNGNWDIFQNLLMKDSASNSTDMGSKSIHVQEEYSSRKSDKPKYASDDFVFTERTTGNGINETNVKFDGGENFRGVVKSKDEELLIQPRAEGEYYLQNAHFGAESSTVKTRKEEEDWITGSKPELRANPNGSIDHNIFSGDTNRIPIGENKRDVLSDDSFMVQSRLSDGPLQTQPKDNIFMDTDIVGANQSKNNGPGNLPVSNFYEPEDLCMVRGHDSAEMDYRNDVLLVETVGSQFKTEPSDSVDATEVRNGKTSKIGASKEPGRKVGGKELKSKAPSGSLGRSKSDVASRSKITNAGSTMEEEKRKKMEELLIQRQKRIAERSAARSTAKGVTPETSKRSSKESKKSSVSSKPEKAKLQAPTDENKKSHKPVMRSSTIDRLAAARATNKPLSAEPKKVGQNRKPTSKANSMTANSSLKKTKGTQERENKVNSSDKKNVTNNPKSKSSSIQERDSISTKPLISEKSEIKDSETVKVLHTITSVEKKEANTLSGKDASDEKNSIQVISDKDVLFSQDNVNDQVELTPQITVHPTVGNDLKPAMSNIDEKGGEKKKLSFSPEISVVEIATPPPNNETNPELIHSRKKWNNGESSPKIPKGFRRLLLFGRRT